MPAFSGGASAPSGITSRGASHGPSSGKGGGPTAPSRQLAQHLSTQAKGPKGLHGGHGAPKASQPWQNPIYNSDQALSGRSLYDANRGLAQAAMQPLQHALDQNVATLGRTGRDWAGKALANDTQLQALEQQSVDQVGQNNAHLMQQLAAIGGQSQQQLGGLGQAAQQGLAQDTATRGQGLSGGNQSQVADTMQTLLGTSQQNAQSAQMAGALNSNASSNYASSLRGTAALKGVETQRDIAGKTQTGITNAITKADISGKTSDLLAKNLIQLRNQGFTQKAAMQKLGIQAGTLREKTANDQAKNALGLLETKLRTSTQRMDALTASGDRQAALAERARHNRISEQISSLKGSRGGGRGAKGPGKGQTAADQAGIDALGATVMDTLKTGDIGRITAGILHLHPTVTPAQALHAAQAAANRPKTLGAASG